MSNDSDLFNFGAILELQRQRNDLADRLANSQAALHVANAKLAEAEKALAALAEKEKSS